MKFDVINNAKIVGKNLKKLRIIHEKTLGEVARASGVNFNTISQIENGKQLVKFKPLRDLLRVYDMTVSHFFSLIQSEVEEFAFKPLSKVQNPENQLLIYGGREDNKRRILLLRPILEKNQVGSYLITLEEELLFEFGIRLDAKINGYMIEGTILIEFEKDEILVNKSSEFQFDANTNFKIRNLNHQKCVFLINITGEIL